MDIKDFNNLEAGTKLLVRGDLSTGCMYNEQTVMPEMERLAGAVVTIRTIVKSYNLRRGYDIRIEEDDRSWNWSPAMFESIVYNEEISLLDYLLGETK